MSAPTSNKIKSYSALDMLKLAPANDERQMLVKLPQEFYDICDVVMQKKVYNKNQEPSLTVEELTKQLYEAEQLRIAKKHKNYLRRQRAKLAKQARKLELTQNADTSSEKSVVVVKQKKQEEEQQTVVPSSPASSGYDSPSYTRDCTGVDIAILAPQKFPKANNNNNKVISSGTKTYKNSRLNIRRSRIGSRS